MIVFPWALAPAGLIGETGARIQGAAVLMDGNEKGIGIVPVNILGTVAVMAVRVHNGHSSNAVMAPDIFDHDRFNVNIAETPIPREPRAWRGVPVA